MRKITIVIINIIFENLKHIVYIHIILSSEDYKNKNKKKCAHSLTFISENIFPLSPLLHTSSACQRTTQKYKFKIRYIHSISLMELSHVKGKKEQKKLVVLLLLLGLRRINKTFIMQKQWISRCRAFSSQSSLYSR